MLFVLKCFYFILPPSSLNSSVFERSLSATVAGDCLALSDEPVFVSGETFEADGPTRVQFARADAKLCAEAVAEAVGEARRGVVIDARRVNAFQKERRRLTVFRDDGLRMARAVSVYVPDGLVAACHYFDRDNQVGILRRPVLLRGGGALSGKR